MADRVLRIGGLGGGSGGGGSSLITSAPTSIVSPFSDGTDFAPNNGVLKRGTIYNNSPIDGKSVIVSFWVNLATVSLSPKIYGHTIPTIDVCFDVDFVATQLLVRAWEKTTGTLLFQANSAVGLITTSTWHHIAVSFDLAQAQSTAHIIVDGTESTTVTTYADGTLALSEITEYEIGNFRDDGLGSAQLEGCMAELYIAYNQYIDLSVAANLEKWRTSSGERANLGADGSTPTGTAPEVLLNNDFDTFHENNGQGGDFSVVNGPLTACATSPP